MNVTVGLRLRDDNGKEWVVVSEPDQNGDFRLAAAIGFDWATGRQGDVIITPERAQ